MEEDEEDEENEEKEANLDLRFNSLVKEFKENEEEFRKSRILIDEKIEALQREKQALAEKFHLPFTTEYETYIPVKFLSSFEEFITADSGFLDELIGLFDMNYNLFEVLEEYGKLTSGINGWEPSSC
jgi:hypothetical protein